MDRSLKCLKKYVAKRIPKEEHGFFCNGELCAIGTPLLMGLSVEEIEDFATASCFAEVWSYRALVYRLGVSVRKADWYWYNA